jgi:glucose-6-phosphate isomerase
MSKNFNNVPIQNNSVIAKTALAAANTARDGSGTIVTLVSGVTDERRINEIVFISAQAAAAANSAMVGRVFLSIDNGATWSLFDEVKILAVTSSTTEVGARYSIPYPEGVILKDSNYKIGVTISVYGGVQDRFEVWALGGDFAA